MEKKDEKDKMRVRNRTYQSKSTVSTHTVTSDTNPASIQLRESIKDSLGQFFSDVAVHVIASIVRCLSGIHVEASTRAKVICIVLALDVQATWNIS